MLGQVAGWLSWLVMSGGRWLTDAADPAAVGARAWIGAAKIVALAPREARPIEAVGAAALRVLEPNDAEEGKDCK